MSLRGAHLALRREPRYLLRRYAQELLVLSLVVALLAALRAHFGGGTAFRTWHLVAVVLAIPFGWWIAAVVHNAGHGNYGSPLVNRIMGELSGAYLGYGFASFVLIHGLHHAHADRTHDPVSPRGMSFLRFLSGPMRHATVRARRYLDDTHGHTTGYRWVRLGEGGLFYANLVLRIVAAYLLFGRAAFFAFYVPSLLADIAILAHINYACHRNRDDGSVEIVNLDGNLYYALANWVTSGGYFHKSHHLKPWLFDPRTSDAGTAPLFSIAPPQEGPSPDAAVLMRPSRGGLVHRVASYFDLVGIWGPP